MPPEPIHSDPVRWDRFPTLAGHDLARKQLVIEAALGLADNTLQAYARARDDFFRFCTSRGVSPTESTREDVALWVRDLLNRPAGSRSTDRRAVSQGLANATIHQKVTAVRLFFDFVVDQGKRTTNPVASGRYAPGRLAARTRGVIPRHRKLPWIPSDDEWLTLVTAVASEPIRNRLMFCLAYDAALRREELCSLALGDFDFANRLVTVQAIIAKGRRQRSVPYSSASAVLLTHYLKRRRELSLEPGPAFLSESRRNPAQPITIWTWSKVVERLASAAGVSTFTTHTFRHLCLTDLARSGWDLHEIATFAGHRSVETTKDYIHLSGRELAAKLAKGMEQVHRWRLSQMQVSLA
jgi:integrase